MTKKKTKRIKVLALFIFIAVFIGLLFFLFSGENFEVLKEIFSSNLTREEIQDTIGKLGIRAYIVVIILAMLQVIMTFIPAEPLHVISGISFGFWRGMLTCLIGIIIGNTIIYLLYKIYGKKLTDYFSANINFDFKTAKASKRIALIVIILYCLPAIPYGIICFFAASLGMKYPKYILITGIGSIPSLVLDVGLGHIAMSTSWIISITVFIVIIVLLILMFRYKTQLFKAVNNYIKRMEEKNKSKVGKFGFFTYGILTNILMWFIKLKAKVRLKRDIKKLDKPCIVLCNHGSFFDFLYAGKILKKDYPHFIVARMYFHNGKLKYLLDRVGTIPKSMFSTDIENSKQCLKVLNNGGVLAMMPEARLSTVGTFEGIQDATYKFIQKMNVAVYTVKINGAYLANPKWGDKMRKGALVEAKITKLLKKEEAQTLSLEELKDKIDTALTYNEWDWLTKHPEVKYKHKTIAKGLENILSICPHCNNKYSLVSDKNTLICEKCGKVIIVDNRYNLDGVDFANISEWYNWQKEVFRKEIKDNPDFFIESKVELRHLSTDGKTCTRHAGYGTCRLDRTGLVYTGTDDGKEITKTFEMKNIFRLLFGAGEDFEIYEGKEIYYFVPEEKRSCVTWYILSELLQENYEEK